MSATLSLVLCLLAADLDRALLEAEMSLESSIESRSDGGSQLPVPELDLPDSRQAAPRIPQIDGKPDEPFWERASLFRWEAHGDSRLRMPLSWELQVAIAGGDLYLAGRREGAAGPDEVLALAASWRERLVLHFGSDGVATARVECAGSTAPVEKHGARFEAVVDDSGIRWELRIHRESPIWPAPLGPLRPLRLAASRGHPGELLVSPPVRLIPCELALRLRRVTASPEREVTAAVTIRSDSTEDLGIWLPAYHRAEVLAGSRIDLDFSYPALPGSSGVHWDFSVGSRAFRLGVITSYVDVDGLPGRIARALDGARENAARGAGTVTTVEARARALENRLAGAREGLEDLLLEARALERETFLARAARPLDGILLVQRFHHRRGPFYTTYLHDMPGGNLCVWSMRTGKLRELIDLPEGASVRDASLSPDGRRAVFALRRSGAGTHLYTVRVDGTDLRQVTGGPHHDLEPCFLPGDRIVFTSTRSGSLSPINETRNLCLFTVHEDGTGLRRLSHNYLVDFTPAVLADGAILFLRWAHDDKPGNFVNSLWTVYPDGRELAGYFGMNRAGLSIEPQPVPGSNRVVCTEAGANGHWRSPLVGSIAVIDVGVSRNEYVYTVEPERGGFKNPFPVGDDLFLASFGSAATGWGIYLVDRLGHRELIYRDASISSFRPVPLWPRREPHRIPELRSPVDETPATLFLQDVHFGLSGVPRGSIERLRVVEVRPRPEAASRGRYGLHDQRVPVSILGRTVRRELGTVPVHPDGSAYFEVPPNRSLYFQALDRDGLAVQTMRDTFSLAPGERRGCVGCHEPQRLAPPRGRQNLARSLRGPPARLEPPAGPPEILFPRDLQPILDRHCVSCHDAAEPAGGVILSGDRTPYFNLAYETLTRGGHNANHQYWGGAAPVTENTALVSAIPYVTALLAPGEIGARGSRLFRLLREGHHDVELEERERRLLGRWVDLNVPYYDDWTSGRLGPERRLLSAASEHTIRAVFRARCRGCHLPPDLFRGAALSLDRPHLSPVLRAPLPRFRGGTGLCRKPVFPDVEDPDHGAILDALREDHRRMREDER